MQPTTLSKSRFAVALTCERKLVYAADPRYVNQGQQNDFLAALADGGHQVGALARLMYPTGIEITAAGTEAQVRQTEALLERDTITLFEPTIRVGNLLVRVDILVKNGRSVQLIEVKSKGFDARKQSMHARDKDNHPVDGKWRPYLYDVAFQTYVVRGARPQWTVTPCLLVPDPTARASVAGVGTSFPVHHEGRSVRVTPRPGFTASALDPPLLALHEVSDLVAEVLAFPVETAGQRVPFGRYVTDLAARLGQGEDPAPSPGSHCRKCEYDCAQAERASDRRSGWAECLESLNGQPVTFNRSESLFGLYNFRKIDPLLARQQLRLRDVAPDDLDLKLEAGRITATQRHHLQLAEARGDGPGVHLERDTLAAEFRRWQYPLHFIDFETARPVLPFQAGMAPYEQILFQFSHHVLEADGTLRHRSQCLETAPGTVPNVQVVRALREALGRRGTVVHWYTHERTVLADMKRQIVAANVSDGDELVAFLDTMGLEKHATGRLADLGTLVSTTVFLPGSGGSSSIKRFLPATLRLSPLVRERYAAPVYGTPEMPSLNFPPGWIWVTSTPEGEVGDPYERLSPLFRDPEVTAAIIADEAQGEESEFIRNGGAAMLAYATLQDPQLDPAERVRLEEELKRYCELDTLAMVMVFEAIQGWLTAPGSP